MNREEIEKLVEESAKNTKKNKGFSQDRLRALLNTLFLIAAAIGIICYFALPENRLIGMGLIGGGMILKVIEFFLRFLF